MYFNVSNPIVSDDLNYIEQNTLDCDLNNSTILITGCAGFLGFYITQYLTINYKKLGVRSIIALDSFLLGDCPKWLKDLEANFPEIIKINKFILGTQQISTIPGFQEVTHILHMASIASPTFYRKYPIETIDANVWGLRNLLDTYQNSNSLKGFVFFSSSEIYGDPDQENIPTKETFRGLVSCTGPRACYDEAKRFGETLCVVYRENFNMPISVVRPFNNYGPGMKITDKRLPADLANCIKNNKDIILFSNGSPTRTFCYVTDAIIGYLKVLTSSHYSEFNIGFDSNEISVFELAKYYREIGIERFNYKGEIIKDISEDPKYLEDNPNRRQPNIQKARELLNYEPSISIYQGIEKYLDYIFYK